MKRFLSILLLLLAAGTASAAARGFASMTWQHPVTADNAPPSRQPTGVPRRVITSCNEYVGASAEPIGSKILFDRVSVPPDDPVLQSVYMRRARPFHYVIKSGFEVKTGRAPVDIRVSPIWHQRMTIGGASSIRFLGCTNFPSWTPWLSYAELYTVKKPACVSLVATVGGKSTRFRVPLGRPCPPLTPP